MALAVSALKKRAKNIRFIAMDVDGVLTEGEVVVLDSGEEIKFWNAKDRLIAAILRSKPHFSFAWITGRSSNTVKRAAKDLGIPYVVQGCKDKKKALAKILKKEKLSFSQAAFIGDDLIDIPSIRSVGFSACPKDAARDVIDHAHYISPLNGGRGVFRDVVEFILRAQKKWDSIRAPFLS